MNPIYDDRTLALENRARTRAYERKLRFKYHRFVLNEAHQAALHDKPWVPDHAFGDMFWRAVAELILDDCIWDLGDEQEARLCITRRGCDRLEEIIREVG